MKVLNVMFLAGIFALSNCSEIPVKTSSENLVLPDNAHSKAIEYVMIDRYPMLVEVELPKSVAAWSVATTNGNEYRLKLAEDTNSAFDSYFSNNSSFRGILMEIPHCERNPADVKCHKTSTYNERSSPSVFQKLYTPEANYASVLAAAKNIISNGVVTALDNVLPVGKVLSFFNSDVVPKFGKFLSEMFHSNSQEQVPKHATAVAKVAGELVNYISFQKIHQGVIICELGYIPLSVVSRQLLKTRLDELVESFRVAKKHWGIPKTDDLLKYQVADCLVTKEKMFISISIPVYEPSKFTRSPYESLNTFFWDYSAYLSYAFIALNWLVTLVLIFKLRSILPLLHAAAAYQPDNYENHWEVVDDLELGMLIIIGVGIVFLLKNILAKIGALEKNNEEWRKTVVDLGNSVEVKLSNMAFQLQQNR